jgi:predicted MFS family arabinose efflux permease
MNPQSAPPNRPALYVLSFGNLVIGTGTLIIAGIINEMAADLATSAAAIGQLITGYGLAVCFGAPLLASLTSGFDRRPLLAGALLLFAAGHLLAALAPGYGSVMALRVITGFGAAIFTPQAAAAAGLLVPPEQRGRAIALVFLGFSIATVLGMPLGAYLGAHFGWRAAMAVIGILALACAALLRFVLPAGLHVKPIGAAEWRNVAQDAQLLLTVAVTVVQGAAQFVVFTYIAKLFHDLVDATPAMVSLLLMCFGVFGIIGNIIAGVLMDRVGAARVALASIAVMLAAFLIWPLTQGSLPVMVLACALWGLGCFAINSAQQARLVELAPPLAPVSIALNSSGIYLGQAFGAAAGGVALAQGRAGLLSWIGAAIFALAIALGLAAQARPARAAVS